MPTPTIPAGNQFMNASLYAGNGAQSSGTTQTISLNYTPDFMWIKNRTTGTTYNMLWDTVRGQKALFSNVTDAEIADGDVNSTTNGFTTAAGSSAVILNTNLTGNNYVGWTWKAGGTAVSNTDGSITSQVSANTTSGFSVVTYTGTGANATVGHGLGVAPQLIFVKRRNSTSDWSVYFNIDGLGAGVRYLFLNQTGGSVFDTTYWNSTAATSSVFSLGTSTNPNASGGTYVAYCFSEIAGYSKLGSYTGNGSTDGPFVFTGFRPRFVMVKRTDSTENWQIVDSARDPYNVTTNTLFPNLSNAESTGIQCDLLSNGFKIKSTTGGGNASGGTYIYMAVAENPFKFSNAR